MKKNNKRGRKGTTPKLILAEFINNYNDGIVNSSLGFDFIEY